MKHALRLAAAAVLLVAASALGISSAQADTTPIPTHVTMTVSPDLLTYGQDTVVTITVAADDPSQGPVDIGNFTLAFPGNGGEYFETFHNPTTFHAPFLDVGTGTFTAHYYDLSGRFATSSTTASVTVLRSDTTMKILLNHTTAEYGQPVIATAVVQPNPVTSAVVCEGEVTFAYSGGTESVPMSCGSTPYTLPRYVPGSYSVSARFTSTGPLARFNGSAAGARSFTVTRAATKTILAVTNLRYHQTPVTHTTIASKYQGADGDVRLAWRRGGKTLHQKVVAIHNGYMQTPLWRTGIRGKGATVVATFLGTANQASSTRSVAVTVR